MGGVIQIKILNCGMPSTALMGLTSRSHQLLKKVWELTILPLVGLN